MTMTGDWYYELGNERQGPCSASEIRTMVRDGALGRAALVWSSSLSDWTPFWQSPIAEGEGPPLPPRTRMPSDGPSFHGSSVYDPSSDRLYSDRQSEPAPWMGFGAAISSGLAKYLVFSGRASRSEFWFFTLAIFLGAFVAGIIDASSGHTDAIGPVYICFWLVTFLPSLAMWVRRLHDVGQSGWMILISLIPIIGFVVLLVFACTPGKRT